MDPILKGMKRRGEPLTLEHWSELALGKKPNQITGEETELVPEEFQDELAQLTKTAFPSSPSTTPRRLPDLNSLPFDPAAGADGPPRTIH